MASQSRIESLTTLCDTTLKLSRTGSIGERLKWKNRLLVIRDLRKKTLAQAAKDHGINHGTIRRWIKEIKTYVDLF
jgi:hypothetical protein